MPPNEDTIRMTPPCRRRSRKEYRTQPDRRLGARAARQAKFKYRRPISLHSANNIGIIGAYAYPRTTSELREP